MGQENRPEWCGVTNAGVFRVPTENGRADAHYHDCNEYWLIFRGKAKIMTEGKTFYVKPGDIVCTKAGDEHDILEVYESLEAFYFEDATPEGGPRRTSVTVTRRKPMVIRFRISQYQRIFHNEQTS